MTARFACLNSTLAVFALSGGLALAQQPTATATAAPPTADSAPAPIERHAPSDQMNPSMQPHRMHPRSMSPGSIGSDGMGHERMNGEQAGQRNFAPARTQDRGNFRQGPGNFREHEGRRMDAAFHAGPHSIWWKNPMLAQRLALTPEQTRKLDAISQQSRLHLIDLHANIERQQALLEPMLSATSIDTTRAMAQVDKLAEARAALEESQARTMLTLRAVLTPDQWTKLSDHRGPGRFGPPSGSNSPDPLPTVHP